MALLQNHLEQMTLSAQSIGDLEFSRPRPFTNALLHNQEITALIRDIEPHERGLFTVDSSIRHSNGQARASLYDNDVASRRRTMQLAGQAQSSAVARVLGNDMLRKIQTSNRDSSRGRGVDIEVLLEGAEKLCAAYDVPGSRDRVDAIRSRHQQVTSSITFYEGKNKKQPSSSSRYTDMADDDQFSGDRAKATSTAEMPQRATEEDIEAEEALIKELEERKRILESRVTGMEKDLGRLRE